MAESKTPTECLSPKSYAQSTQSTDLLGDMHMKAAVNMKKPISFLTPDSLTVDDVVEDADTSVEPKNGASMTQNEVSGCSTGNLTVKQAMARHCGLPDDYNWDREELAFEIDMVYEFDDELMKAITSTRGDDAALSDDEYVEATLRGSVDPSYVLSASVTDATAFGAVPQQAAPVNVDVVVLSDDEDGVSSVDPVSVLPLSVAVADATAFGGVPVAPVNVDVVVLSDDEAVVESVDPVSVLPLAVTDANGSNIVPAPVNVDAPAPLNVPASDEADPFDHDMPRIKRKKIDGVVVRNRSRTYALVDESDDEDYTGP